MSCSFPEVGRPSATRRGLSLIINRPTEKRAEPAFRPVQVRALGLPWPKQGGPVCQSCPHPRRHCARARTRIRPTLNYLQHYRRRNPERIGSRRNRRRSYLDLRKRSQCPVLGIQARSNSTIPRRPPSCVDDQTQRLLGPQRDCLLPCMSNLGSARAIRTRRVGRTLYRLRCPAMTRRLRQDLQSVSTDRQALCRVRTLNGPRSERVLVRVHLDRRPSVQASQAQHLPRCFRSIPLHEPCRLPRRPVRRFGPVSLQRPSRHRRQIRYILTRTSRTFTGHRWHINSKLDPRRLRRRRELALRLPRP